jgi:phosphoserine phosphatase RsbU/P
MSPNPQPSGPIVTMQCMEVWGGNQATDNGVTMPGLDAWVFSRPYEGDDAGGDIHYVSSCATGRITRVLVADVSGHGQQVAKVASSLRTLMRRYVNYIDQSRLVRGLNVEFASLSDSGSFATAIVASYFAPTDQFVISNAGHPRPFRYDARKKAWEVLKDAADRRSEGLANIPLGIAEPTLYDQITFRLARNDLVLIYTDSLIEASAPNGRQLGEAGLLAMLNGLDAKTPERLIPALLEAVEAYAGAPPKDDITVLLLRPNAFKPRPSAAMAMKATVRIAATCFGVLKRGAPPIPWPQFTVASIFGAVFRRANGRAVDPSEGPPPG